MLRDDEQLERAKPEATGLESYRRLILLQKQMIELSQQHEETRRHRDALRESVAREVADQLLARKSSRYRLQRGLVAICKRLQLSMLTITNRFRGWFRTTPSTSN